MSYYNTTNIKGDELKTSQNKAVSQENKIFDLFTEQVWMSPSDAYHEFDARFPITSIRRAFSNLTKQGKIYKTSEKELGLYGRLEHLWKVKTDADELRGL
tara:strand:+ start:1486 stop:1785 length:300 start_codon:yes stop_codon:yes gene_type:complete